MKKVAQKAQVRKVAFEGPVWVGVDVHKKSYSVAITDKQGVSRVFSMAADDDGLVPVFVPEKQGAGVRTLQRRRHKLTDLQRKPKPATS